VTARILNFVGPTDEFELEARRRGYRRIAGLDEAGRGPLAGPVVASAVVLPSKCRLVGCDDSKLLTEAEREQLYVAITQRAIGIGIGSASHEEVDRLNILEATRLAMHRALTGLQPRPDCLLVDAISLPDCVIPIRSIIMGDALCRSVAAASIVATVTRDRLMAEYHRRYPHYNFLSHKGYGTEEHLHQLAAHGPCLIHRRTYAPVAEVIALSRHPRRLAVSAPLKLRGQERDDS
jgi:ribonuclease HII